MSENPNKETTKTSFSFACAKTLHFGRKGAMHDASARQWASDKKNKPKKKNKGRKRGEWAP